MPQDMREVVCLTTVLQQMPQFQMPFQAYAYYAMGSLQVNFSFRVEPSSNLSIYVDVFLVSALYSQVPLLMSFSPMGAQLLGFTSLLPPLLCIGGGSCYLAFFQPFQQYGGAYRFGGLAESHLNLPPSLHGGEGSSFSGLVPTNDIVNSKSVLGMKPGDSGVVIGYMVDEFTCTWSAEHFVAHSHIYPGFTGKVSSLTHFPFEQGCEDYSFLDKIVADFEQGLDSILTDSDETPELDASFEDIDGVPSSVSSGFLFLVRTSTILINCSLLLA